MIRQASTRALELLRMVCGGLVASSVIIAVCCFIVTAWVEVILDQRVEQEHGEC